VLIYKESMRLLVVEDDLVIANFITKGLREAGYAVDMCGDGEEALNYLSSSEYDLVVLDLMLPKRDGLSVVEQLRRTGDSTPVLILSAKRSVDERVAGLQQGGDDYLTKPFSFSELLARVQVLLRRHDTQSTRSETTKLIVGDVVVDLLRRDVRRNDKAIELQAKEFALLEYFIRHPDQVLSKTQILEKIWNYQFDPQTNVVDVLVFRLRAKLDKDFDKKYIHTIRGVGYVLRTT
jgi:two-component system, OmpR family, response regulator